MLVYLCKSFAPFRASFYLFSSFQYSWWYFKFAVDWTPTADLWCQTRLLYQLSHNHCPMYVPLSASTLLGRSLTFLMVVVFDYFYLASCSFAYSSLATYCFIYLLFADLFNLKFPLFKYFWVIPIRQSGGMSKSVFLYELTFARDSRFAWKKYSSLFQLDGHSNGSLSKLRLQTWPLSHQWLSMTSVRHVLSKKVFKHFLRHKLWVAHWLGI